MNTNVPKSKQGKEKTPGAVETAPLDSRPELKMEPKKESTNANISASYERSYGKENTSSPSLGTSVPAGKSGRGEVDALTAKHETQAVRTAKESGGVKEAHEKQNGRAADNMTQETLTTCDDCKK